MLAAERRVPLTCLSSFTACTPRPGLRRKGAHIADNELQRLMESVDLDGNSNLDFEEFLTATVRSEARDVAKGSAEWPCVGLHGLAKYNSWQLASSY
jgi:hypothetical protein